MRVGLDTRSVGIDHVHLWLETGNGFWMKHGSLWPQAVYRTYRCEACGMQRADTFTKDERKANEVHAFVPSGGINGTEEL